MASSKTELVSTKEVDYLDEDKPIRNQNYVCLSFISPEDILLEKEVYMFSKYVNSFSKEMNTLLDGIVAKYPDAQESIDVIKENYDYIFTAEKLQEQYKFFKHVNGETLERDFHEIVDFKPSIRGIKVRGVFDTLKEAQVRADLLKRMGDKFNIYVAQVGCWCPWSPNPDDLENQEYAETQLNTLMKKYKEGCALRDEEYEMRKNEKINKAKETADKLKAKQKEEAEAKAEAEAEAEAESEAEA